MKPNNNPFIRLNLTGSLPALVLFAGFVQINTAQAQWLATPATNAFGTTTNWTSSLVNGNFTQGSTITTLSVANDQQISTGGNIIFSGASTPGYTLGLSANAGYFDMFSGASIQMLAGVTTNQVVNAGFNQAGSTANKATIITASAVGQTLTINGNYNTQNLSGSNLAGLSNYLNLGGTGGTGILNGVVSDGRTAGGAAVIGNIIVKKQGTASYTLNGVNTYTGGTEMGNGSTGTVTLGNNLALGTGAIRVISGTGGTGSGFLAGTTLTGAGAIANTFNHVGTTGTSTSTSTTTFTQGSATAGYTGTAPVVGGLVTGNALGFLPNYTRVVSVDTGAGTVTFDNVAGNSGSGTFSSALFNSSGGGTSTISGTNAIEFSGTQNLTTTSSNLGSATQIFNIENTADTTFSGVLQQQGGTASVTKTGAGRLLFSNTANTYTGTTSVNVGILNVAALANGGLASSLGAGANTVGLLTFAGGTLQFTGSTAQSTDRLFTINTGGATLDASGTGSGTVGFTNTGNLSVGTGATARSLTLTGSNTGVNVLASNLVTGSSTISLNKNGGGTWALTGANTYTGNTTINAGTLQIGNGGATGSLSNSSAIANNGTLAFDRTGFYTQTNLVSGSGSVLMTATLGTATGVLTLNNAASSYSGTTTIQNGDINVGANSILASTNGPLGNASSAIILGTAGTQASSAGGGFGPNAAVIVTSAGAAASYSITRDFDSSATANVTGRSNVRFNGPTGATGTLTVSSNWTLGTGANRGYGLVANQPGQTLDFTGAITGSGSTGTFRINDYGGGTGFIRLSNSGNTYAGPTTVTNGTLLIAGNAGASSGVLGTNSILNVAEGGNGSNGNAALTDGAFTVDKTITLQNSTITTSTWTLGGNQAAISSFTGNVNTASNANNRTLNLTQVAGGSVTFGGIISANPGAGATSVDKIGAGTVVLTNANSYDGTTAVTSGTLFANNTSGSATGAGVVSVGSGGTLGGTGSIAGQVNVTGVLAPGASIESLGTGNLNFLTGSTLAYELNSLGFNGDLVASTGTLDIASGALLTLDQVAAGTLAPGSKLTLISYFGGWTSGELFTYDGSTLGDDTSFFLGANEWMFNYNDSNPGTNFSSDQAGASSFVTITVVPEPAAALLGGLGILTLLRRRRLN